MSPRLPRFMAQISGEHLHYTTVGIFVFGIEEYCPD